MHTSHGHWRWVCFMLLGISLGLIACDQDSSSNRQPEREELRVVSLAPAITQMMIDMGVQEMLVGVAENDMAAPPGLPVAGNFVDVNSEKLLALKPTHVLMMVGKSGAPANVSELARAGQFELITYPSPNSITDVAAILFNEGDSATENLTHAIGSQRSLGVVLQSYFAARRVSGSMFIRLEKLREVTRKAPVVRTLVVIGLNPIMASGPQTPLDELLVYAGGVNVATDTQVQAPTFDAEKLTMLAPHAILLIMPSAPPLSDPADPLSDPRLAEFKELDVPAIRQNRIHLINDPLAALPSSSMPRIAAAMAKALYPHLQADIDAVMNEQLASEVDVMKVQELPENDELKDMEQELKKQLESEHDPLTPEPLTDPAKLNQP